MNALSDGERNLLRHYAEMERIVHGLGRGAVHQHLPSPGGAITRPSASVRSVWYRMTVRLCCCRVVGVHMTSPRLVQETLGITAG